MLQVRRGPQKISAHSVAHHTPGNKTKKKWKQENAVAKSWQLAYAKSTALR